MVEFLEHLNNNTNNIVLDHVISEVTVNFLDVTITKADNILNTKVFFKPTDRNNYLSIRSGLHLAWIKNIPKGQMLRVRHNCTEPEDYFIQASILRDKFVQKGYSTY